MATMVNFGSVMIRINTEKNSIEYSKNGGRTWSPRYSGRSAGVFYDLCIHGSELFACTSKGVFVSKNEGQIWSPRYTGSSAGVFQQLTSNGSELMATTSKGLYVSKNEGRIWSKR